MRDQCNKFFGTTLENIHKIKRTPYHNISQSYLILQSPPFIFVEKMFNNYFTEVKPNSNLAGVFIDLNN